MISKREVDSIASNNFSTMNKPLDYLGGCDDGEGRELHRVALAGVLEITPPEFSAVALPPCVTHADGVEEE